MNIVSLFSGAGGLDLGIVQAGHHIVWANDIDADAVATYRANIGNHIVEGDIKNVRPEDIPECDVVIGGFPCQGFSVANLRRNVDDERNTLYRFFCDVVRAKQPKYFIAENVKGLLSLGGGKVILAIVDNFRQLGYQVEVHKVNMADYGVPQLRQRVIILGQRNDVYAERPFHFPQPTNSRDGQPLPWVSISEAIGHYPNPDEPNDVPNHVYSAYHVAYRNFTAHRRTDPNKPSPTILARGNGKGGVCAIPHYNGLRRLSVRESAAVQSFPDDFVFYGSKTACYRQIGNAVPPRFSRLLGNEFARIENEQV